MWVAYKWLCRMCWGKFFTLLFYFAKCSTSSVLYPTFLKCMEYTVKNIGLRKSDLVKVCVFKFDHKILNPLLKQCCHMFILSVI